MSSELDRTRRIAVPGGTRAGNEGMKYGDVVQGSNQETQNVLVMRSCKDPKGNFWFHCNAGFIHVPRVNGVYREPFEGDIRIKDLKHRYCRPFQTARIEVFDISKAPIPISVPVTAVLSDGSYADGVVTTTFEFATNNRAPASEFHDSVEKLENFLNGDFKESTVFDGGNEAWTYLTASSMRKSVEAHLGSLIKVPMSGTSSPLLSLPGLRNNMLDLVRHDALYARYAIKAVSVDLSFGESQVERNHRLMSELDAMSQIDRRMAEISHENNMIRLRYSKEEAEFARSE